MQNEPTKVLIRVEDAGTTTKLHEPFGVQTHGGVCTSLLSSCTGQPSSGFAGDGIGGNARVAEVDRMDLEGGGEVVASL